MTLFFLRLLSVFFVLLVVLSATPVEAQDGDPMPKPRYETVEDIQVYSYIAVPKMEAMARAALSKRPYNFDFTSFRSYYSRTRQYDPTGEETLERLLKIAYTLDTTKDEVVYKQNMIAYQNLIMRHMAHLGVVMQAAALSKEHKRYGDPEFFAWLKAGLINDVMISGDGYSLRGAYDVITMAEELVLFERLGMQVTETIANQETGTYYNMHTARDLRSGRNYTIFVNTTFAMKFLTKKAELQRGFLYRTNKDLGFIE